MHHPTDPREGRVLANFMDAGRLVQIPARRKKRMIVLRWLADHFRPGERYTEAQVNELIGRYHEDFALLRRLMVDEELMQRAQGLYWRAGTLPYPTTPAFGLAAILAPTLRRSLRESQPGTPRRHA